MTTDKEDIIEIKFDGNGVNPSTVQPSEIAELINDFQEILLSEVKKDYPEINTDNLLLFTFEQIKNESLGIPFNKKIFKTINNDFVGESFRKVTTAIETSNYTKLSEKSITALKRVSKFTQRHVCVGHFKFNNDIITTMTPKTEIKENRPILLKGMTTIYGEIVEVGNNIHIKMNDGIVVYVDADKSQSKQLGSKLWEFVGIRGIAKWDAATFKITDFKLLDILDYNPTSIVDAFKKLQSISSGVWDNYNSETEINNQLLRE